VELVQRVQPPAGPLTRVAGEPDRLMIELDQSGGHLMSGAGIARAWIEPKADRVLIEPPQVDSWLWNRWVLGQVLPLTAGLRGRELLHAGAVVLGGEAVAVVGPSGAGKSTLVGGLVDAGAAFLADDVVALEPRDGRVIAHPGPGVLTLEEPRFLVPERTCPVSAIALLQIGQRTAVETLPAPDPPALLGNVYERVRRDPERLAGQLALLADLAAAARFVRVRRGVDATPAQLARRLLAELEAG